MVYGDFANFKRPRTAIWSPVGFVENVALLSIGFGPRYLRFDPKPIPNT